MNDGEAIFRAEANPGFGLSVAFEDDGRVAYAYLIDSSDQIIADVWLYNRTPAPHAPEWRDRQAAPYLNPVRYVRPEGQPRPARDASEVEFRWLGDARRGATVEIFLRGLLIGRIWPGAKPGWAASARSGPLAVGPEDDV
jgi:hypothetical protein